MPIRIYALISRLNIPYEINPNLHSFSSFTCYFLIEKRTLPTNAGMFQTLVANPIPNVIADSTPINSATSLFSSLWAAVVPDYSGKGINTHVSL